jgi:4-hydroxy-tetrahydrodipicolinate reductase
MKIAIIGYGKMGREVEIAARKKGHEINLIVDIDSLHRLGSEYLGKSDVAIEFTTPGTAMENIIACFNAGVPVVSGTTGWHEHLGEIEQLCREKNQAFFYASNFSIGVNIMFRLNGLLAGFMNKFPEYDVRLTEIHHIHKKDSPSGTAITLAGDILQNLNRKTSWKNALTSNPDVLPVISERHGEVPGTHSVTYKSPTDILEISHQALNRSVFAEGALLAAEFITGKTGIYRMDDLLDL